MPMLRDIALALGLSADTLPDRRIERVATFDEATTNDLSYITSERYLDMMSRSRAGVVLASASVPLPPNTAACVLTVADAELSLAAILPLFAPPPARPAIGIHPSAVIDPTARIGDGACIGANAVVGAGTSIGRNVTLHDGAVIGQAVVMGDDCELFPNVVIRERVRLGNRVIIHANSTIGSDGFGYRWDGRRHAKVPQIGDVEIGDDVEIGSNTCVDRAKFGTTRVGPGTKIDNLVQIGHNVQTGAHCIICGQAALAGSATLGNGVIMGGGSAVTNHVHVADRTTLAARTGVMHDTQAGEVLAGAPAVSRRDWLRERALIARLPELLKTMRQLEVEVERLKNLPR